MVQFQCGGELHMQEVAYLFIILGNNYDRGTLTILATGRTGTNGRQTMSYYLPDEDDDEDDSPVTTRTGTGKWGQSLNNAQLV